MTHFNVHNFAITKSSFMDPEEIENRILELKRYNILDSDFEEDFDNITWLASKVCDMPIALISLLDESRQ